MSTLAQSQALFVLPNGKGAMITGDWESNFDWTQPSLQDAADAAKAAFTGGGVPLAAQCPAAVSLVKVTFRAYDIVPDTNPNTPATHRREYILEAVSDDIPVAGTGGAGPAPANVAIVVSKLTGVPGRRNRGRVYLPFLLDSDIADDSTITNARALAIRSGYDDWTSNIENSATPPDTVTESVVTMMEASGSPNAVISHRVGRRVDTQRRRLQRTDLSAA